MSEKLQAAGVDFEFFDAVDGRSLPRAQIEEIQAECSRLVEYRGYPMQASEIGCALSHAAIYQKMLDDNLEYACILEDDIQLEADFKACLDAGALDAIFGDRALLLMLGHRIWACIEGINTVVRSVAKIGLKTRIAKPIQGNHGTHAYIVNQAAAKILLRDLFSLSVPLDDITGCCELDGLPRLVASPPVVRLDQRFESLMLDRIAANEAAFPPCAAPGANWQRLSRSLFDIHFRCKQTIYMLFLRLEILKADKEIQRFRVRQLS